MKSEYETVWSGGEGLCNPPERDYVAMTGEGWDLWYVPPSPLVTDWDRLVAFAQPDPDAFVPAAIAAKQKRQRSKRTGGDPATERIQISQMGSGWR